LQCPLCFHPTDQPLLLLSSSIVLTSTVAENEKSFTKREVKAAQNARELKIILGYPSDQDMIELIRTEIKDSPIDEYDIRRAQQIYGKNFAELKGKTTLEKSSVVKIESSPRPISEIQTLHVDIMFIESKYSIPYISMQTIELCHDRSHSE
jgi:hypothetical protein